MGDGKAVDWKSIRPVRGDQRLGFGELCCQLARQETPADTTFIRKGAPDAGVECYSTLKDGSEWGWQSKYFDALGESQWAQIDKSVKTALQKHSKLVRFFVCIPLDRSDARLDRQKSALDKWNRSVSKWNQTGRTKGMKVDFVVWGSSELMERLSKPGNEGKRLYLFGEKRFDAAWFKKRFDEAVSSAGPRYTPEIRVDLPISQKFEAFGRTPQFLAELQSLNQSVTERLQSVMSPEIKPPTLSIKTLMHAVENAVEVAKESFTSLRHSPAEALPLKCVAQAICRAKKGAMALYRHLSSLETNRDHQELRARVGALRSALSNAEDRIAEADEVSSRQLLLIQGDAGSGKTHLLCDVATTRLKRNMPTVLLMGQRFATSAEPWSQALSLLDCGVVSIEGFVGALESAAQAANARALILIDALNEGMGRELWPTHLEAFLAHLKRSPWIGVVLSVRTSHRDSVIPDDIAKQAVVVEHHGFAGAEYEALRSFFLHYRLELPSTPLLTPEFSNPLFLKTLCDGLKDTGAKRLPRSGCGFTAVFESYLGTVEKRLAHELGYDQRDKRVHGALYRFALAMMRTGVRWLSLVEAKQVVNEGFSQVAYECSLYFKLVSQGLLSESKLPASNGGEADIVNIGYERYADHLIAEALLAQHFDEKDPSAAFAAGGGLAFLADMRNLMVTPGLLEALCLQVAEKSGKELVGLLPSMVQRHSFRKAFRQSLVWRSSKAFSDETANAMFSLCWTDTDCYDTLEVLLTAACLPEHALNAMFLHEHLSKYSMPERDAVWSQFLHSSWCGKAAAFRLVDWASKAQGLDTIEDDVTELCATVLTWMLTCSNRTLRDRTTKALVGLLTNKLELLCRLVERFHSVNDLYVLERLYAVAYGVAMRCWSATALAPLANVVFDKVFAHKRPPSHILLRDYARGVVERALVLGASLTINPTLIRPPYQSTWPHNPSENEISKLRLAPSITRAQMDDGQPATAAIELSVFGGDFCKYVMAFNFSPHTGNWLSVTLKKPAWVPKNVHDGSTRPPFFKLEDIQRYVFWRVFDLGWTGALFGHFDRLESDGFVVESSSRPERIGKKYQWIAYHEMCALVSDRHQYIDGYRREVGAQKFQGPWQNWPLRDIDPSCLPSQGMATQAQHVNSTAWWCLKTIHTLA